MLNSTLDKLQIKGDRVLVKQLGYEEKVGSFYVPDSVRDRKAKRRGDAWKGEVLKVGDGVDFEVLHGSLDAGDVVYLAPVSLDCPAFETETGDKLVVVTQEDLLAKEIK